MLLQGCVFVYFILHFARGELPRCPQSYTLMRAQGNIRQCRHNIDCGHGKICCRTGKHTGCLSRRKCHKSEVHEYWGRWSKWGPCTVTCGGGQQQRSRKCYSLTRKTGTGCTGKSMEVRACASYKCNARHACNPEIVIEGNQIRICTHGKRNKGQQSCIECPLLSAPRNSNISLTCNTVTCLAVYTYKEGVELDGNPNRTCTSGEWTGSEPECEDDRTRPSRTG